MVLLFILGLGLIAAAIVLAVRVVAFSQVRIASQVKQIDTYGFHGAVVIPGGLEELPSQGPFDAAGRWLSKVLPSVPMLERRELLAAGMYDVTPEHLHGLRVVGAIGAPALFVGLFALGGSLSGLMVIVAIGVGAMLWLWPTARIRSRGQKRLDRIDRDLPELIDVLIATIEAGLGFGGSLQLVAQRFDGPLGDELRLTLQEQQMGLSVGDSLGHLLERAETPSTRSFVKTIRQGDALGVSIGSMLRNLAVETRQRRRARAREKAQRAPIKLLFPLVFLIFPSMLLVLMYPMINNIVTSLNGS